MPKLPKLPKLPRDARLETREQRGRLKQAHEPYWRLLHQGLYIGYRKGARGGVWIARHWQAGAYRKEAIGRADDYEEADGRTVFHYRGAVERAYAFAKREPSVGLNPTVDEVLDRYLEHQRATKKSAGATENKAKLHIRPAFGKRRLAELTTDSIKQWHAKLTAGAEEADRRRKQASANRVLTVLKAALNMALHEGLIDSDLAWRRVKPFRNVDAARIRYLSTAEAKRLINKCEPDFRALVRGALLTGARYGELVQARVVDFNAAAGTLYIADSKSGKPRHIPLTEEGTQFLIGITAGRSGEALLFTRSDGSAWGPSHQIRRMAEACARAKITPAVSFHDLRHTYGSLLAAKGVPLQVIAEVLGHADTRITQRHYAHLHPSHVAKAVRAALPKFGVPRSNVRPLHGRS